VGSDGAFLEKNISLGTFSEQLQKSSVRFIMLVSIHPSIHPSICMEQLGSHWMDFREILY
jgi:hypothetical protein